jgi:TrmH family RNA methyltransferase
VPPPAHGFTACSAFASLLVMPLSPDISAQRRNARASETIASRDNRWLKRFRAALAGEPTRRSNEGLVAVEGFRLVATALQAGVEVVALLTSSSGERYLSQLSDSVPPTAMLLTTTDALFAQVAATETPQGIAALVRQRVATFDDLLRGVPLIAVLAGVQDPGNVGALIRAAEAFGASGAAICSAGGCGTANPWAPKALRASAGSALRLPVVRGAAAPVFLAQLRVAGIRIYAACPDGALTGAATAKTLAPWEVDWRVPAAVLIGNEGAGLPADLVRSADAAVSIPQAAAGGMQAPMDSLNAAVAGSVLLYEAARQRHPRS